jgi:hypothetical protein
VNAAGPTNCYAFCQLLMRGVIIMITTQALPTMVVTMPMDGERKRALIVAPDGIPKNRPLYPFEIIGIFDPDSEPPYSGPGGFRQNGVFLQFLHWVIGVCGPTLPSSQEAARALDNGLLQIIDGRAYYTGVGEPADEDIFGTFEVKDGKIVDQSYRPTLKHRPLTDRGLFELESALCEHVLEQMAAHVAIKLKEK